jgi:hypothetical protein
MQLAQRLTMVRFRDEDMEISNSLKETPTKILEREYKIFSSAITVPNNGIKPYELLLNLPQIQRALYGFKFFKSDIKLRVLINSTPMYYGMLCVSWLPDFLSLTPLVEPINADPMVMDIASQDALEFTIPFISLYDSIKVVGSYSLTSTPFVNFATLGYARGSSDLANIKYDVYASFVKPLCWGAQSIPTIVEEEQPKVRKVVISQSGAPLTFDNDIRNFKGSESMVKGTDVAQGVLSVAGVAAMAIPVVGPAISAAVTTAQIGLMAYDLAQDAYQRFEGSDGTEREDLPDPIRQNPSAVRNQAFGDMASTVYTPSLNLTSNLPTYFPPFHKGDPAFKHRICDCLRTPTIRSVDAFTGMPPNKQILIEPFSSFDETSAYVSYLDMVGCLFRFWRGSIKVSFMFYTSPFITATYRFLLFNADGDLDPLATDPSVYAYKKVVTIRGTTRVDLVIPYLSTVPWQNLTSFTGSPGLNPALPVSRLYVETVVPPNPIGDQTPYVFMMTMISAGDDFQVKDLRSPTPSPFLPGVVQSQMRVRTDFHGAPRSNLAGGSENFLKFKDLYEDTMTFEDASMRASRRISTNASYFQLRMPYSGTNLLSTDTFDFIQQMFRYVRGSIRVRFTANQPIFEAMMHGRLLKLGTCDTFTYVGGNGEARNTLAQNSVFDLEVPFQCQTEWVATTFQSLDSTFPTVVPPVWCFFDIQDYTTSALYVNAGRDYQLAFMLPPRRQYATLPPFACVS